MGYFLQDKVAIILNATSLVLLFFFSTNVFGINNLQWKPSLMLGYGETSTSQTQTIRLYNTPDPGLTNRYVGQGTLHGAALFGFALETQLPKFWCTLIPRLGGELDYLRNNAIQGTVQPMINIAPDFDQLKYVYDIRTFLAQVTGKLSTQLHSHFNAYLQGGLGFAINQLANYREYSPDDSSAAPMLAPFHNNNTVDLAYSLGIGLSYEMTKHVLVSLGYRFICAGKAQLNPSNLQQTNDAFTLSRLDYQFIVIGFSLN